MRLPRAVRQTVGRIVGPLRWPVRAGPNQGLVWSLASAGRGYLSGRFEDRRVRSLLELARAGDRVWDVGAHKGYITLALSRAVGLGGRVVAIEPAAANLALLRRHLRWNRIDNVEVVRAAISDRPGEGLFGGSGSTLAFQLGRGDETVRVATLAELTEQDGFEPPELLKIDTEGNEAAALRGAGAWLEAVGVLCIAVHSRALHQECSVLLRERGFVLHESADMSRRSADPAMPWGADHELIAAAPRRSLSTQALSRLPLMHTAARG